MTTQEAIDYLLDPIGKREQHDEAIRMAVDALEKQIPKRPKYKAEDRFVKNHVTEYSYCPVCEKEVVAGDMFCVMCGQAIDWGDE